MKRKIIQLGSSTLVTSIPSKWVKQYDIKAGDEINIETDGSRLIIGTQKEFDVGKKSVDFSQLDALIQYGLLAIYIQGVDNLEIQSSDSDILKKLHSRALPSLLGFEVVNIGRNNIHIKDIAGSKDFDFKVITERILDLLKQMHKEISYKIENKDTDLGHIPSLELSLNKFAWLCLRVLNKKGVDPRKNCVYFYLVSNLESIGDLYHQFSKYVPKFKIKFSKKNIEYIKKVGGLLEDYEKNFFKFDKGKAADFDRRYRKLAGTPGNRYDNTNKTPDSDFEKLITECKSIVELRAMFIFKQIADFLGDNLRMQLVNEI